MTHTTMDCLRFVLSLASWVTWPGRVAPPTPSLGPTCHAPLVLDPSSPCGRALHFQNPALGLDFCKLTLIASVDPIHIRFWRPLCGHLSERSVNAQATQCALDGRRTSTCIWGLVQPVWVTLQDVDAIVHPSDDEDNGENEPPAVRRSGRVCPNRKTALQLLQAAKPTAQKKARKVSRRQLTA